MGADTQVLGIVARETPELCISVCVLPSARALVSDLTQTPGGLNATSRTRSTGDTKGPIQSTCRVNRRCSTHESQSEAYTLDLTTSPEQALSPHKDARASDRAPQGCRLLMCNIMQLCGPSVVRISHPLPDVWRALDWASCRIRTFSGRDTATRMPVEPPRVRGLHSWWPHASNVSLIPDGCA